MKTVGATVAVAVAVVVAVFAGCSGGDGGDGDDGAGPSHGGGTSEAAELAERLGCRDVTGSPGTDAGAWLEADVRECTLDGAIALRIHGSLTPPHRAAAVRLLAMEAEADPERSSCLPAGRTPGGIFVVAGDSWVAVVRGEAGAAVVADELGGEVQPGQIGTPVSYPVLDCLPGDGAS